ncbi:MAG TPA: DUF1328 domain-containing protein [Thermoanaerobaculia bacterium]|nr:DUF1328 domain-containing protein [Thermoanaerobaculia bacterium]
MTLLKWAAILFVVALILGVLGFGGIASGLADIAGLLFWIFIVIFVIVLIAGLVTGKKIAG